MSDNAAAILTVVIVVGGIILGYPISLWLHPETACDKCKGAGRHHGTFYTKSRRQCTKCGGKGRMARMGTWIWERSGGKPSRFRSP